MLYRHRSKSQAHLATSPLSSLERKNNAASSKKQATILTTPKCSLLLKGAIGVLLLIAGVAAQDKGDKAVSTKKPPISSAFKCKVVGNTKCCDEHEWCEFWQTIGECVQNKDWMSPNCAFACKSCPFDFNGKPQQPIASSAAPTSSNQQQSTATPTTASQATGKGGLNRCEILRNQSANNAETMAKEKLVVSFEDTRFRRTLSLSAIQNSNAQFGCAPTEDIATCNQNLCYHLRFRTLDGTCNNFDNPMAGSAYRRYRRILPAAYDNGFDDPVSSSRKTRPSSRDATRFLLSSTQQVTAPKYNGLLMTFGQFMSHDLLRTTLLSNSQCTTCQDIPGRCFNIPTDTTDARFGQFGCLRMSRSAPVCGTGGTVTREQLNENTAYLDASNIYGSSLQDADNLRNGRSGFLRTTSFNNKNWPPFDTSKCFGPGNCQANFQGGDIRANLFVGLAAFHTLFVREHNRLVEGLTKVNPQWDGDRLYHEARKIIGAIMQKITYDEWLPKILGDAFDSIIGNYSAYDPKTDPTIANEFASGAFRFGHGMIQEMYLRVDEGGTSIPQGSLRFDDGVFQTQRLLFEGGIDPLLRGMLISPVKRPQRLTNAITERMFGSTDLASTNIQRGRDHGLAGYNSWRQFCNLGRARSVDDLSQQILDPQVRQNLAKGFTSTENVDLYVGCMLEDPIVNGLVGPTLACLLGEQFNRLRDGDRFWYENPGIFTPPQVKEIKSMSMARILCNDGDAWQTSPFDAFMVVDKGASGSLRPCKEIHDIDLSKWRDP